MYPTMANDRNANIKLTLNDTVSAGTQQVTAAFVGLTAAEIKAEQQTLKMAQAYARLDAAQKNPAQGADRLREALSNATVVTQQHGVAIQTQIAGLDNQAARLSESTSLTSQFGSAVKSSLLGAIGPAAALTVGIGLLKGAIDLTEESFKFKAALDTTNLSIALQIKNFRDVNQTMNEGRAFAEKYNITQKDNAEAIQASIPLLRQTKSSLTDVEGVLARLAVLKPEQGIQGAAFALGELEGGQSRSLNTRFNIPLAKANELKKEIVAGGDAVQIVGHYLDTVGVGMDALSTRTQGATGKMNQLEVETEKLQLALAGQSGGVGEFLLDVKIKETQKNTRILSGDLSDLKGQITNAAAGYNPLVGILTNYAIGVFGVKTATQQAADANGIFFNTTGRLKDDIVATNALFSEDAQKKLDSKIASVQLADEQQQLAADSARAAEGLLGAGDQALILAQKYGIAADQAQFLINQQQKLSNAGALADQRKGEQTGTDLSAAQFDKFDKLARQGAAERAAEKKKADDKAAADAARLQDATNAQRLTSARTTSQKIAELERQKSAETDPVKKVQLETQIIQERNSSAKAHTGELGKQLTLHESIYDSLNKQKDAQLDIEELTIKGRQADRDAAAKDRVAQRILNSPNASADLKARAADVIALDDVEKRKRAQALIEKQATAGGSIVNGRLLQSVPGTGGAPAGGGAPAPIGAPAGAGASASAGGATIVINLDGKVIATVTEPYIMDAILKGLRTANAGRGI
jgi:hypothetical protein